VGEYKNVVLQIMSGSDSVCSAIGMPLVSTLDKVKKDSFLNTNARKGAIGGLVKTVDILNSWRNGSNLGFDSSPYEFGFSAVTYSSFTLAMRICPMEVPTFRFLGMDVTEDLDIVVPGTCGTILVSNLYDFIHDRLVATNNPMSNTFSKENLKVYLEKVKFGDFTLNSKDIEGNRKVFEHFYEGGILSSASFHSVVLNIVGEQATVNVIPIDVCQEPFQLEVLNGVRKIGEAYSFLRGVIRYMDLYYKCYDDIIGGLNGVDLCGSDWAEYLVGKFRGYCDKPESMFEGEEDKYIRDGYVTLMSRKEASSYYDKTDNLTKDLLLSTMVKLSPDADFTEYSENDLVAYSVLDAMKFSDKDLVFSYDSNENNRGYICKNILKSVKRVFADRPKLLDDGVVNSVIDSVMGTYTDSTGVEAERETDIITPKDVKSEDSMIINKAPSQLGILVKSATLIDKVLKRAVALF
jgi:hypothetical protein